MLIDRSEDNAALPGEVQLSEMFGISRNTLRAVLAEAVNRGYLNKMPQKGHIVMPRRFRTPKVGIVFDNGKESPHIHNPSATGALIQRLTENDIKTQVIQANSLEGILWRAMAHRVDALFWINSSAENMNELAVVGRDFPFPQMVITTRPGNIEEVSQGKLVQVNLDVTEEVKKKAEYIISRNHQSVAHMGEENSLGFKCLKEQLVARGIDDERIFLIDYQKRNWTGNLIKLCKQQAFSMIYATGPVMSREEALNILNTYCNKDNPPEIILFDGDHFEYFLEKFPDLNIVARSCNDNKLLGNAAANELVKYIKHKAPMQSLEIPAFELHLIAREQKNNSATLLNHKKIRRRKEAVSI